MSAQKTTAGGSPSVGKPKPEADRGSETAPIFEARFGIGDIVRHRIFPFRGVIFDVDPEFANTEEWWQAIPEDIRPRKDQPFYHLLAENEEASYIAYVSQQNLIREDRPEPVHHPAVPQLFATFANGRYQLRESIRN
jgi:heat shock protein HspQ